MLATNGDTHLGGDDFDRALLDLVVDELRTKHGVDVTGEADTLQEIRLGVEAARILCRARSGPSSPCRCRSTG